MRLFCLSALSFAVACGGGGDDGVDRIPDAGASSDVLTKTTAEPAGSNCQYGGTEVQVGIDKNGNGILDADEVQSTFYICDPAPQPTPNVFYGELFIGSAGDVAAAQSYTGVVGDVVIDPDSDVTSLDVALPNLAYVSGLITDCNPDDFGGDVAKVAKPIAFAANLDLAALQVTGSVDFECGGATTTTLAFPAMTAIHGYIFLSGAYITSWSAPLLATVEQSIDVNDTSIAALTLPPPGTTPDAELAIVNNPQLDDCAMNDLAGEIRRGGFRGSIDVAANGAGLGSGSGDGSGSNTCTDATHLCQEVTIDGDATSWRQCNASLDWPTARAMCQAIGSGWDLAFFTSIAEEESVGQLEYQPAAWIGYYQGSASAPYAWVQNSSTTFAPQSSADPTYGAFWSPGEPSGNANPDCVQIFSSDDLNPSAVVANDALCGNGYQPLCRYLMP